MKNQIVKIGCMGCLALTALGGCSDSSPEEQGAVRLVVTATRGAQEVVPDIHSTLSQSGALKKAMAEASGSPLRVSQSYSFTPTALVAAVDRVILFTEWVQNTDGETIGGGNEIPLEVGRSLDLMSAEALEELYSQTFTISEEQFGVYVGSKILMKDTIWVSGTATVNGVDFSVNQVAVPIGFSGSALAFSEPLVIADTAQSPSLHLVVETENVAILSNPEEGSGADSDTPTLEDGTHVGLANMVVLAWVGDQAPRIEKYGLVVDGDTTYALKVMLLLDSAGQVVTGAIQPVFFEGFAPNGYPVGSIYPAMWTQPIIEGGAVVSVAINPLYVDEGAADRWVSLDAFERKDHAGTLGLGYPDATDRTYEAKLYQVVGEE